MNESMNTFQYFSYFENTVFESVKVFRCPPFTLLPIAQFFVYLLYIDLSPCLEGHLDPELIQVVKVLVYVKRKIMY